MVMIVDCDAFKSEFKFKTFHQLFFMSQYSSEEDSQDSQESGENQFQAKSGLVPLRELTVLEKKMKLKGREG